MLEYIHKIFEKRLMKCFNSISSPEKKAFRKQTFAIFNVGIKRKDDISRISFSVIVSIGRKNTNRLLNLPNFCNKKIQIYLLLICHQ